MGERKARASRKATSSRGGNKTRAAKKKTKRAVPTRKTGSAGKVGTPKGSTAGKAGASKAAKTAKTTLKATPAKPNRRPVTTSRPSPRASAKTSKVAKKRVASIGSCAVNGPKAKAANPPAIREATRSRRAAEPPAPISEPRVFRLGSETIELADEGRPLPKSKLGKRALWRFSEMLLAKRRELVGDVENLTHRALSGHHSPSDGSYMPLHMADIGSDNWEQEFTLDLLENERALVREIDEALQRMEDGTYGMCLATHRPIRPARLAAKPWAKYCIEYARLREQGLVP